MSNVSLRNLKDWLKGPNKCCWEVTTLLRIIGKNVVQMWASKVGVPSIVLEPPKKAAMKGEEVPGESS